MDYFLELYNYASTTRCLSAEYIVSIGGSIVKNNDGTISVFVENKPYLLNEFCCKRLNQTYFWDADIQKCRYRSAVTCSLDDIFKITLNPNGNDGTIFSINDNESCFLDIEFNYILKLKCESLVDVLQGTPLPSVNEEEIAQINLAILEQEAIYDRYTKQKQLLAEQISTTLYSITCNSSASATPIKYETVGKTSFPETGFAPFSYTIMDSFYPIRPLSVTYCISEPTGLSKWQEILGDDRYYRFLDGDATSYNCTDVFAMETAQAVAGAPTYITLCTTPFGTKSDLIKQNNEASRGQKLSWQILQELQTQLDSVSNSSSTISGSCKTPIDVLEQLDVSLLLEVQSGTSFVTILEMPLFPAIGTGNLYNYLTTHDNSGFFICGDPTNGQTGCTALDLSPQSLTNTKECEKIIKSLLDALFTESGLPNTQSGIPTTAVVNEFLGSFSPDALHSDWLHYANTINDSYTDNEGIKILDLIKNKKIKISFKINTSCTDFCILVDDIKLNKNCTIIKENKIFVSHSPGFTLDRIRDNKKSWINNTTRVNRNFDIRTNIDTNIIRQTDYDINDERLVINSKEIDLDIDIADAIETDVWCYLSDNPCLLTGTTCVPLDCLTGPTSGTNVLGDSVSLLDATVVTIANCDFFKAFFSNIAKQVVTETTPCGDITKYYGKDNYEPKNGTESGLWSTLDSDCALTIYSAVTVSGSTTIVNYDYGDCCASINDGLGKLGSDLKITFPTYTYNSYLGKCTTTCTPVKVTCCDPCNDCTNGPISGTNILGNEMILANAPMVIEGDCDPISGFITTTECSEMLIESTLCGDIIKIYPHGGYNVDTGYENGLWLINGPDCDLNIYKIIIRGSTLTVFENWTDISVGSAECCAVINEGLIKRNCGFSIYTWDRELGKCVTDCTLPTRVTGCCGDRELDFTKLLTESLSGITTVEDFEYFVSSQLIDTKDRQTLSAYPTLRALYDRYMNSTDYCTTKSSSFDYITMDQFAGLLNNYWVDLIEQVVPATTIWGNVKVYSNTIFDQPKFQYKKGSLFTCTDSLTSGFTSIKNNVGVDTIQLTQGSKVEHCSGVYMKQMDIGSEFIGSINIIPGTGTGIEFTTGDSSKYSGDTVVYYRY